MSMCVCLISDRKDLTQVWTPSRLMQAYISMKIGEDDAGMDSSGNLTLKGPGGRYTYYMHTKC